MSVARSPHAQARIKSVSAEGARGMRGVPVVITARDLAPPPESKYALATCEGPGERPEAQVSDEPRIEQLESRSTAKRIAARSRSQRSVLPSMLVKRKVDVCVISWVQHFTSCYFIVEAQE
jgi:CO/xanthine dehydrogenase Mo-binding subunit